MITRRKIQEPKVGLGARDALYFVYALCTLRLPRLLFVLPNHTIKRRVAKVAIRAPHPGDVVYKFSSPGGFAAAAALDCKLRLHCD
jgi:hypothetical protein